MSSTSSFSISSSLSFSSSSSESSEDFPEGEDGSIYYAKKDSFVTSEPYWYSQDAWHCAEDIYLNRKIEKDEISILSYNVWFKPYNVNSRMIHLVETVKKLNPDFITMQELTGPILKLIVDMKWMRRYYVTDTNGGTFHGYGNAIFSKYRFHEIAFREFDDDVSKMGRKVLLTTFITDLGKQFTLGTFHLESYAEDADKREIQLGIFRESTEERTHVVLCGDTNFVEDDEDAPLRPRFSDTWQTLYQSSPEEKELNPGYSYDTTVNVMANRVHEERQKRLDRCFYTNETIEPLHMELVGTEPFRESDMTYISDHFGIFMRLRLKK